jgi:hypothetical protein
LKRFQIRQATSFAIHPLLAAVVWVSVKHFGANLFYRYNQDSTQHFPAIFSSGSLVRSAYFFFERWQSVRENLRDDLNFLFVTSSGLSAEFKVMLFLVQ